MVLYQFGVILVPFTFNKSHQNVSSLCSWHQITKTSNQYTKENG